MALKNEALQNLWVRLLTYNSCVPKSFINLFIECDDAIEGEIATIKAELTDANRRKDIYHGSADHLRNVALEKGDELRKANNQIDELKEKLNNERKHGEELADVNRQLASENVDLKEKTSLLENSRTGWRSRAQHFKKRVMDLNEKIHELEEENAKLRATQDDAIRVKSLERANKILRRENGTLWTTLEKRDIGERTCYKSLSETIEFQNKKIEELEADINTLKKKIHELKIRNENLEKSNGILRADNETLWSRLEERDLDISKRPWHGDGNAMTSECSKSIVETIEEFKAEKARPKENVDLSPGHEFEFGDEVFVPWSDGPYMYVKRGMMYNPRTERLVYVGKDQHLKWFGEKFSII